MIRAIVYDAVGTLIHVHPNVESIYADVGERFGSRLEPSEIRRRFHAAFARQEAIDQHAGWRTDENREVERWQAIVAEILDDVSNPSGCFDALFQRFGEPNVWRPDPEAVAVLDAMQRDGVRQALASNFDGRLHAVIAPLPIATYLKPIVVSSEIGWRKPSPVFFAHLADALELPADAILFVGDDRGNDYEPARHAGMKALLVDPARRYLDVGNKRIERFSQLIDVVRDECRER